MPGSFFPAAKQIMRDAFHLTDREMLRILAVAPGETVLPLPIRATTSSVCRRTGRVG
jgi:hypothetical protein